MSKAGRRQALGKGLDSLLKQRNSAPAAPAPAELEPQPQTGETVRTIPVAKIDPNPHQPRTMFDTAGIEELARSIKSDGVIQPILVRPQGSRFLIVVGERRWRAAKLAGLAEISAVVREIPDEQVLEIALVENIQREDLNPIEVAVALQRLSQELQLSHEELAQRTGKDRTTVTNLLRLLRLPSDIQALVADKRLTMGHARTLLSLDHDEQQRELAANIIDKGLSVRQTEQAVRTILEPPQPKERPPVDPNVEDARQKIEFALGAKVTLVQKGKKGRIEIEYSSQDELDRIYSLLTGEE